MMSSKKKDRKNTGETTSFASNWEVQAEQLKYSVKKEVEEANLIQEAMKSLQRSFRYEEEKRLQAEFQRGDLRKQIEELEHMARELKEKINLSKETNGSAHDGSDEEEDSEEDVTENEAAGAHHQEEEYEFEELLSEIRDEESAADDSQLTVQQRLKLLQGLNAGGLDGERAPKKTVENYKAHHKKVMKAWRRRDHAKRPMFAVSPVKTLSDEEALVKNALLQSFVQNETEILQVLHVLITKYVAEFVQAKILAPTHVRILFSNLASFQNIHSQLLDCVKDILAQTQDFRSLGGLLSDHAPAFLQFIGSRKESTVLLRAASSKPRFKNFLDNANLSADEYLKLQDQLIGRITSYPTVLMGLLPYAATEYEYRAVGKSLVDIMSVLDETGTAYQQLGTIPNKLQMIFTNYSFDWLGKDTSFFLPDRKLMAKSTLSCRNPDKSLERCYFYLFSDVVVVARDYMRKQIFKYFIPLEELLVWDVPPKASVAEYLIELVDIKANKKHVLICSTQKEQERLLAVLTKATLAVSVDNF